MERSPLSSLVFSVALGLSLSCGPTHQTLRGQIFIVTRGGESVKLGLVEVRAITAEALAAHADFDRELGGGTQSPARLFFTIGFPDSAATTKTDADGRFSLTVPRGLKVVLAAAAQRQVGGNREAFHWLVKPDAARTDGGEILLSNDNVVSSGSPASAMYLEE
jgi:hypothetical protein